MDLAVVQSFVKSHHHWRVTDLHFNSVYKSLHTTGLYVSFLHSSSVSQCEQTHPASA